MFHSRLCLLNKGAAHANVSQFWPQRQRRRNGTNSIASWNKWHLARSTRRRLSYLAVLAPGFKQYAYPLPAGCLLIGCSGVLVTIRIVNEMRLDYSPIYAGFAYKTTESLWNWCALLRCIVCSQDDTVLVHPELLVPVRCCGRWSETVRASCTSWCGDTRGLCVQKWFGLGDECTRLSFDRRGAVLWTDPPAPVWTSVANCRHLRASCSQTVRMGWCKASGKVVTLVSAPNCAVGSDRSVHCAVQGCASKCTRL